jgi:hypothetical protein
MTEIDFKQAFGFETGAQGNRLSDDGFGETDISSLKADPTALMYLAHEVNRRQTGMRQCMMKLLMASLHRQRAAPQSYRILSTGMQIP